MSLPLIPQINQLTEQLKLKLKVLYEENHYYQNVEIKELLDELHEQEAELVILRE